MEGKEGTARGSQEKREEGGGGGEEERREGSLLSCTEVHCVVFSSLLSSAPS